MTPQTVLATDRGPLSYTNNAAKYMKKRQPSQCVFSHFLFTIQILLHFFNIRVLTHAKKYNKVRKTLKRNK